MRPAFGASLCGQYLDLLWIPYLGLTFDSSVLDQTFGASNLVVASDLFVWAWALIVVQYLESVVCALLGALTGPNIWGPAFGASICSQHTGYLSLNPVFGDSVRLQLLEPVFGAGIRIWRFVALIFWTTSFVSLIFGASPGAGLRGPPLKPAFGF